MAGRNAASLGFAEKEQRFLGYHERLLNESRKLIAVIEVYKTINRRKRDRLNELNIAPAFFGTVEYSLFSNIIVWGHKLYDAHEECGVPRFLTEVGGMLEIFTLDAFRSRRPELRDDSWVLEQFEPITATLVREDKKKIKGLNTILSSLELRRNKYHAHYDAEYFFEPSKLDKDAPLTLNGFDAIADTTMEILNRYTAAFDGNTHVKLPLNMHDLDGLLDKLHAKKRLH